LNKHRGSGLHIISQECFKKIGLILNLLLDEVYESKDFITSKYCLILSQTYNKQDEITNKKISLQDTIEKNELLRNLYFWEEYTSCKFFKHNNKYFSIKNYNLFLCYLLKKIVILLEEVESSNLKQGDLSKETEEEKNNRLGNIFFSQLIHICYNMISFKIRKKDIKDIILTYSQQNNLPVHYEEQLVIMIDSSDYIDFIEMAKIEKERLEFEHEYNQIASEKNYKGFFNDTFEKIRSKSDYVYSKGSKSFVINNKNNCHDNSKNFDEINYEIIGTNHPVNNEFKKMRSQSFYESSNSDKVLREKNFNYGKRNSKQNIKLFKNLTNLILGNELITIPEHYINNDLSKIVEKEMTKNNHDFKRIVSSEDEIKVIDEFYGLSDKKDKEKIAEEIKNINIQEDQDQIKENSGKNNSINKQDIPEVIQINQEENEDKLIVSKITIEENNQ
jgi:hypothetical protein